MQDKKSSATYLRLHFQGHLATPCCRPLGHPQGCAKRIRPFPAQKPSGAMQGRKDGVSRPPKSPQLTRKKGPQRMLSPPTMHLLGPETRGLVDDDDSWNRSQEALALLLRAGPGMLCTPRDLPVSLTADSRPRELGAAKQLLSDKIEPRRGPNPLVT